MKKVFTIVMALGLLVCVNNAQAQRPVSPIEEGTWTVNAGIGTGLADQVAGLSMKAAVDKGCWQVGPGVISLGAELGWALSWDTYYSPLGNVSATYTDFYVGPRGSYHYGWQVPGLDTYAGFAIGPIFEYASNSYTSANSRVGIFTATHVGASYFFTSNFGVNAEMEGGYNILGFYAGVIFRF